MNSNIAFESNVYPVRDSIMSDKEFLSKIWDYNRIYAINSRYQMPSLWNKLQKTILKERPYCAYNPSDPCYGMLKTGKDYIWVGMCTKTDCEHFKDCRKTIPFDPEFERAFIPDEKTEDEYGYSAFIKHYRPNPIIVSDKTGYIARIIRKQSKNFSAPEIKPVPFSTLLQADDEKVAAETGPQGENITNEINQSIPEQSSELLLQGEHTDRNEAVTVKPVRVVPTPAPSEVHHSGSDDGIALPEISVEISSDSGIRDELGAMSADDETSIPYTNIFDRFRECSQKDIIEAGVQDSFFVDAGPGTGKTYTLIQKLNYLVTEENADPEAILVLCFTNAAVDEIKSRLRTFIRCGADRSLANIDVRTFHSFAWWLIGQANTEFANEGWIPVNLQSLSYDSSLRKAEEAMIAFGKEIVSSWEHFIVDEVQDLTNERASFVLSIVDACIHGSCGITVLGDACQAIYDYNQPSLNSSEFYKALFYKMNKKAKFVFLTENHRQGRELISMTEGLRAAILHNDVAEMKEAVNSFISTVPQMKIQGATLAGTDLEGARDGGTISLLLRNNGQTLKMSSDLRKRGVEHVLNITETRNNFAPWISDVFANYRKASITEDDFSDLYMAATGKPEGDTWYRLQRLMHTDNDVLDVRKLLDAIAVSKIDDPIFRSVAENSIIVSNIHRSKGREYDCVIVDRSFAEDLLKDSTPEEYRTLYVAITRPKTKLLIAQLQNRAALQLISIFATKRKRWGKAKGRSIRYLEFDSSTDLDIDTFAYGDQQAFDRISIGDEIRLQRIISGGRATYSIVHDETDALLGMVGPAYVLDMIKYMQLDGQRLIELPAVVNDLYVSGIYSQVVPSDYLIEHPELMAKAPNGVWKWVDLVGVGHADYDVY